MEKAGEQIITMHDRAKANIRMAPEPRRHAHIPKQMASNGFSSIIVLSDIDSFMWLTVAILDESQTEMPQYISVTCGMCGVISGADS